VTLSVMHRVAAERAAEFEAAVRAVTRAARDVPGFLGDEVFRSASAGAVEYRLVMRFASQQQLEAWQASGLLRWWAEQARDLAAGPPAVEQVNGLEAWFVLPDRAGAPPPRWKTAVVSALAIYPIISLVPAALAPVIGTLPGWLARAVTVAVLTPVMTWGSCPSSRAPSAGGSTRPRPRPPRAPAQSPHCSWRGWGGHSPRGPSPRNEGGARPRS
jgi:antibiotic biosynthesis monooxygenase (ABM) superfamily enzyme